MAMDVGFLGLGAMGRPMAANLAGAGHRVIAWNRSPFSTPDGVMPASSPAAVAAGSAVTFVMVTDAEAVQQVLFGVDGWATAAGRGATVVQSSTIGPAAIGNLLRELAQRGVRLLDAPVSGSVQAAERGELTVLGGGDTAHFEELSPLFEAIAKKVLVLGRVGTGSATKLCVNAILISAVAAAAEALTWLTDNEPGVDLALVTGALERISPVVAGRVAGIVGEPPSDGFSIRQVAKDMQLITEQLAPAPVLDAVAGLASSALAEGMAARDLAALGHEARRRRVGSG
jgi:3-hydroxyisobutyrate dehydrogenase-like beta-hydroxyacid dehydrogenase